MYGGVLPVSKASVSLACLVPVETKKKALGSLELQLERVVSHHAVPGN